MKNKRKKLRKLPCFLVVIMLIGIINLLSGGFAAKANDQNQVRELQSIQVAAGDTLWDLVSEYYHYDSDIRKAIYEVKQINNLDNAKIIPGQIIYIPRE